MQIAVNNIKFVFITLIFFSYRKHKYIWVFKRSINQSEEISIKYSNICQSEEIITIIFIKSDFYRRSGQKSKTDIHMHNSSSAGILYRYRYFEYKQETDICILYRYWAINLSIYLHILSPGLSLSHTICNGHGCYMLRLFMRQIYIDHIETVLKVRPDITSG